MDYQKTRNYREKEKIEKRAQKKREASKKRYFEYGSLELIFRYVQVCCSKIQVVSRGEGGRQF